MERTMNGLTNRQGEVLEFILRFQGEYGYPPTIREIREAFHLRSNRGVVDHLKALEKKGYIRRDKRSSRAIEVLHRSETPSDNRSDGIDVVKLPLLGRVEAGAPATPGAEMHEGINLDRGLFGGGGDFLLEVKGDSMTDDHIIAGDLVVVRRTETAENGDTIVVMVDGEATVKRYYKKGRKVILQPANPLYKPIVFEDEDARICTVLGKVVGIIRRY
jgi:repressor LexA